MNPEKRVEHIAILKPEICTIDLNTMNSGKGSGDQYAGQRAAHGQGDARCGVKREVELLETQATSH